MKSIKLNFPSALQKFMPGIVEVDVEGDTLMDLFSTLDDCSLSNDISERIIDDGELRPFLRMFLDERDVKQCGGLSAPIKDGDELTILMSNAGG
ncbi:MoaD/ThiS family protein [Microbulbifer sp. 2205BS26-8]|uniref:MoaD/ThiS family protein n=1 Tax=Microbulbifer sp. 2205BS26-8 TaxID=3064386 RepID=UPI00273F8A83|nr:MoaD/ThiS family protein [Microbulbifer sp. 2205BS26-8]MDP5210673.1 MoaD/ThiS family protein [Microbulbifer sp. 2205BS26-8]